MSFIVSTSAGGANGAASLARAINMMGPRVEFIAHLDGGRHPRRERE